jgi:hypothetical protein
VIDRSAQSRARRSPYVTPILADDRCFVRSTELNSGDDPDTTARPVDR